MQSPQVILETFIIYACIGFILVICIAYMMYHQNKRQLLLRSGYEKEVIKAQMEIQESTLIHLSQEIHDNIAQLIVLAKRQLTIGAPSLEEMKTLVNETNEVLDISLSEIRCLSRNMNSDFVVNNGLWHSVQQYADQIKRRGHIKVEMTEEGDPVDLNPQTEIMLYRIIQESVANILKHSQADTIVISFCFSPGFFRLGISDNGIGFEVTETINNAYKKGSSGLQNIIKRAGMINATYSINSKKQKGTLLCITTPC